MEAWQTPSCRENFRGTAHEDGPQDIGWMIYGIQVLALSVDITIDRCIIVLCCRNLRKGVWVKVSFGVGKRSKQYIGKVCCSNVFFHPHFAHLNVGLMFQISHLQATCSSVSFPNHPFLSSLLMLSIHLRLRFHHSLPTYYSSLLIHVHITTNYFTAFCWILFPFIVPLYSVLCCQLILI